ncbi:hypothetical protein [Oceanithermus sp.]
MKPVACYPFYTGPYTRRAGRWLISRGPDEPRGLNAFDLEEKRYAWSSDLLPDCMVIAGEQDLIYAYPGGCQEGAELLLLTLDARTGEVLYRSDASPAQSAAAARVNPQIASGRLFVPLEDGARIAVFSLGPAGPSWEKTLNVPNSASSGAALVSLATAPDGDLFLGVGYESCDLTLPMVFRLDVASNLAEWAADTETCSHRREYGPDTLAFSNGLVFASFPQGFFVLDATGGYRLSDLTSSETSACGWAVGEGVAVCCPSSPAGQSFLVINLDPKNLGYEYGSCGAGAYPGYDDPALIRSGVYYRLTGSGILAFDIENLDVLSLPGNAARTDASYLLAYGSRIWAAGNDGLLEYRPLR